MDIILHLKQNMEMKRLAIVVLSLYAFNELAQEGDQWEGKFDTLGTILTTPNEYPTGSGAPGPAYWKQQADSEYAGELDDEKQRISGKETITYHNNAPEDLRYLWLQLDQNILAEDNLTAKTKANAVKQGTYTRELVKDFDLLEQGGGYNISSIVALNGEPLKYTVNHTMMRIDLPEPLRQGKSYSFPIEWS